MPEVKEVQEIMNTIEITVNCKAKGSFSGKIEVPSTIAGYIKKYGEDSLINWLGKKTSEASYKAVWVYVKGKDETEIDEKHIAEIFIGAKLFSDRAHSSNRISVVQEWHNSEDKTTFVKELKTAQRNTLVGKIFISGDIEDMDNMRKILNELTA